MDILHIVLYIVGAVVFWFINTLIFVLIGERCNKKRILVKIPYYITGALTMIPLAIFMVTALFVVTFMTFSPIFAFLKALGKLFNSL